MQPSSVPIRPRSQGTLSRFRPLVPSFVLLALLAVPSVAVASLFPQLSARYPVGDPNAENPISFTEGPKNLAAGDLNEDGLADIVAANLDGSVSVLLGRADGSLEPQRLTPATGLLRGASLRDAAVADFDGDGHADVVVASIATGVIVLRGDGSGNLVPTYKVPLPYARSLDVADLDEDGHVDVFVACSPPDCEWSCRLVGPEPRFLAVLPGTAEGSLGEPRFVLTGYPGCLYDVSLGDINGDGALDAVSLDYDRVCGSPNGGDESDRLAGTLLIFPGRGDGTFQEATSLTTVGRGPRSFALAYLDEVLIDGKPQPGATLDIVVANRDSATLEIFLTDPLGRPKRFASIPSGDSPRAVAAGDLNGDGLVELVVTNRNTNTISVFRNLGSGRFSTPLPVAAGTSPREIVLADVNGDGSLDAAVNNRISEDVSLFIGRRGLAGFLVPETYYPAGITPVGIASGDFDEDGYPDIASVNLRSHDIRIRLNAQDGDLGDEVVYPTHYEPSSIVCDDVDRDGHLDLLVACAGRSGGATSSTGLLGSLLAFLGRGDGTFEDGVPTPASEGEFQPYWLRLGDLSGDGVLDAAVGSLAGTLALYEGRGDGTFGFPRYVESGRTGTPLTVTLGDFNEDGWQDIATSGGKLVINNGELFSRENEPTIKKYPVSRGDWVVESADLDEDGSLDLIVALTFVEPDPIAVHFGRGDGTFLEPTIYPTGMGVVALQAADMDRDGIIDIVAGNRCTADVTILRGLGDRTFERMETIRTYSVEGVVVTDLNQDGNLDIAGVGVALWTVLSGSKPALADPKSASPAGIYPEEGVYINELMAQNRSTWSDLRGRTPDWVEIYNHHSTPISLRGWKLAQDNGDGTVLSWVFPDDASIPATGHLLVLCETKSVLTQAGLVCGAFELSSNGETLVLIDPKGKEQDRISYPEIPEDISFARFSDGARYLSYNPVPTPGRPNAPPTNMDPSVDVRDPSVDSEGGLYLTARTFDDIGLAYAAVHYRVEGTTEFEETILKDDGRHHDRVAGDGNFGALLDDIPPGATVEYYVRVVDLEGQIAMDPADPTVTANFKRVTIGSAKRSLRISEVVALNVSGLRDEQGQSEDWIELANCGTAPLDVGGFLLAKNYFDLSNAYTLPQGLTLEPGRRLVVFCDEEPLISPLHAPFRLDRQGDTVLLLEAEPPHAIVDSVSFGPLPSDTAFGIPDCDGEPAALARPTPGAPNVSEGSLFVRGDANADSLVDITDPVFTLVYLFGAGDEPGCADAADADDTGAVDITDAIYVLNYLFLSGAEPGPPFGACGPDLTPDSLRCESFWPCRP